MKAYRERAVTFGPRGSLTGILTTPAATADVNRVAIVILNAGIIHHVGPNRLHVRLARTVAPLGHMVLRFDLSGIGDSDPRTDEVDLMRAVQRDIGDALTFLATKHQVESFIICGLCSGAVNGFLYAIEDPRVIGTVMIDPVAFRTPRYYALHYARRLFSLNAWRHVMTGQHPYVRRSIDRLAGRDPEPDPPPLPSPAPDLTREEMDRGLAALVARNVQQLVVFTGGLDEQYNYASQFHDTFPHHSRSGRIHVKYFPSADHTFSDEASKTALIQLLLAWLATHFALQDGTHRQGGDRLSVA